MKNYLRTFLDMVLSLTAFVLVVIPIIVTINWVTGSNLGLKIGASTPVALPPEWKALAFIEGFLLFFFLFMLALKKFILGERKKPDLGPQTTSWSSKQIIGCEWDFNALSVNGLALRSPLDDVKSVFGKPEATTPIKLSYPRFGLDIFIGEKTGSVVLFYFHIQGGDSYKPCSLKMKTPSGQWHTFFSYEGKETIRSIFGEPKASASLEDGSSETFLIDAAKVQVFYKIDGKLNLILFSKS